MLTLALAFSDQGSILSPAAHWSKNAEIGIWSGLKMPSAGLLQREWTSHILRWQSPLLLFTTTLFQNTSKMPPKFKPDYGRSRDVERVRSYGIHVSFNTEVDRPILQDNRTGSASSQVYRFSEKQRQTLCQIYLFLEHKIYKVHHSMLNLWKIQELIQTS